jgi:hypothetical protein
MSQSPRSKLRGMGEPMSPASLRGNRREIDQDQPGSPGQGLDPATLAVGGHTHSGVLPQPRTLEGRVADNPRGRDETDSPAKPAANLSEGSVRAQPSPHRHPHMR